MRFPTLALVLLASAATLGADTPQQSFVKAWKGQAVVVRTALYSLVYNERGRLGTTHSGRREGVLVVTSSRDEHFQFDGRQGRDTVVARDAARLVDAVSEAYKPNTLDVRPYRRIEPLAVEQFAPGSELVVRDVRVARDEVRLDFELPDGSRDTATSLRVKWPLPLSPSFTERALLEDLLRQFVEIRLR